MPKKKKIPSFYEQVDTDTSSLAFHSVCGLVVCVGQRGWLLLFVGCLTSPYMPVYFRNGCTNGGWHIQRLFLVLLLLHDRLI